MMISINFIYIELPGYLGSLHHFFPHFIPTVAHTCYNKFFFIHDRILFYP